jgi:hypothetical protein
MNTNNLFSKFHVTKPNGTPLGCGSFVLVPFHPDGRVRDQAAADALKFYAERCAFPGLDAGIAAWAANPTSFNWLNNPVPIPLATSEEHTPEPWHFEGHDDGDPSVGMRGYPASVYALSPQWAENAGDPVELFSLKWPTVAVPCTTEQLDAGAEPMQPFGHADANAARIVACVNAMQGIADPAAFVKAWDQMREALADMLSGWRYIRSVHGDLSGVGWDRAEGKAAEAMLLTASLRPQQPTPAPTDGERTSTVTD